jgi:gliding motility-associated-like protein
MRKITFLYLILCCFFSIGTAKTVVVNSLNPTSNYGVLAGAHFDANGNFISDEMSLPVAIWLTSGANLCGTPSDPRYKQYCGADTILFNIDPKYAGGQTKGPYVLTLSQGVQIYDQVFIDGFSQPGASIGHPMIYITGTDNDTWQISAHRTYGDASGTRIRGTGIINTKNHAFYVSSVHNVSIEDNYVGVNTDGSASTGLQKGIHIGDGANNITVSNNVFSGAHLNAIEMNPGTNQVTQTMGTPHDIHIIGNKIGTDITGTQSSPQYGNSGSGININGATGNIEIKDNVIGYNGYAPVANQSGQNGIDISSSTGVIINSNFIGVGADGVTKMPNSKNGIALYHGTGSNNSNITIQNNNISFNKGHGVEVSGGNNNNVIVGADYNGKGNPNIISYNAGDGIHLENYGSGAPNNVVFRMNSVFCNSLTGITLKSGSNTGISTPVIDLVKSTVSPVKVVGTAPANSRVDLYIVDPNCFSCASGGASNENQGKTFVGSVDADASGNWQFPCGAGLSGGVVAHASLASNNSSAYSNIFKINCTPPPGGLKASLTQPPPICQGSTTALQASHTIDKSGFPNPSAKPVYIFSVDGVEVGRDNAGGLNGSFSPAPSAFNAPRSLVQVTVLYTKAETGLCYDLTQSDTKWIEVFPPLPPPSAGPDAKICSGTSYKLSGNAGSFPSIIWTSNGDGSFDNNSIATATYTPGTSDIKNGSVKLSLTGTGSCNSAPGSMILTLIPKPIVALRDTIICNGGTVTLDAGNTGSTYLWSNGPTTQTNAVGSAATYTVTVTNATGCSNTGKSTVTISPNPIVNLGNDTAVCAAGGPKIMLDAGNPGMKYLWSTTETTQKISTNVAGTYSVTVTNSIGCQGKGSVKLNISTPPVVSLRDTAICAGGSVRIDPGVYSSYLWSTGAATEGISASTAGKYSVTVKNAAGCSNTASMNLKIYALPLVELGPDQQACKGSTILLDAGNPGMTFLWNTGATTQTIPVKVNGVFWAKVTDANKCASSDSVTVQINPNPGLEIGNDTAICSGNSIAVNAGLGFKTYVWSTGANTSGITVRTTGKYWVTVTDSKGCKDQDSINITVNPLPIVHIVKDTATCASSSITLDPGTGFSSYLWSTGATSEKLVVNKDGKYIISVTDKNGCKNKDSSNVVIHPLPLVTIGSANNKKAPGPICQGQSMTLDAGAPFAAYNWSTGEKTEKIVVKTTGEYIVVVTDANGCKNSDTLDVTVLPLEHADFKIDGYCDYSTAPLPVGRPGFTPGGTFSFNPAVTGTATIDPKTGRVTNTTAGSYRIQYKTPGTCYATAWDTLHVFVSPVITAQPQNFSTCGGDVSFQVTANNTNSYQWQEDKGAGAGFVNLTDAPPYAGSATNALSIKGVTALMNNFSYRCILTTGTCTKTSNTALLAVNSTTKVLTQPAPITTCAGKNASFTITASGVKTFQWQLSTDGGKSYLPVNGSEYANASTAALLISPVKQAMDAGLYRCFIYGCAYNDSSNGALLTLLKPAKITTQPTAATVCVGADTLFNVAAVNASSFQWLVSTGGNAFTPLTDGPSYAGALSNTLHIKNADVAMNGNIYRCMAIGSCDPDTSVAMPLTVHAVAITLTGKTPICIGDSAMLTATGASAYLWSTGQTAKDIVVKPILTSSYSVTGTFFGCKSAPQSITVTVLPKPKVKAGPGATICPKAEITLGQEPEDGYSYWWTSVPGDFYATLSNIKVNPKVDTKYILHGKINACPSVATDTATLHLYDYPTLYIPNAFTPNDDGNNDVFMVSAQGVTEFHATIFNRWGELIYQWNNINEGWNGETKLNSTEKTSSDKTPGNKTQLEVYTYIINVKNLCNDAQNAKPRAGIVTVVR